ncbi:MAG: ribbon-helix-helix protein, CopG family [Thermoanaerobaculia bacterium]
MKTAISVQESLFERADALAEQLHLSRSQLFSRALDEFLKKHETRKLREAIDSALEGEPDPGEEERMRLMRRKQRRRVEGQW